MTKSVATVFTCDYCKAIATVDKIRKEYNMGPHYGDPYDTMWPEGWYNCDEMKGKTSTLTTVACPSCRPRK